MKARAEIVAEAGRNSTTAITHIRSQSPLSLHPTGSRVWLVSTAGGPVGGDDLRLNVLVRENATLTVGSVASMIVQPGLSNEPAWIDVDIRLESGARLEWNVEPTMVTAGAWLRSNVTIRAHSLASLGWVDTLVISEPADISARIESRLRIERDQVPLMDQALSLGAAAGPGWDGAAVLDRNRVLYTEVTIGNARIRPAAPGSTPAAPGTTPDTPRTGPGSPGSTPRAPRVSDGYSEATFQLATDATIRSALARDYKTFIIEPGSTDRDVS